MATAKAPGRLGDPEMTLATDPRTDPKLLEVLQAYNMAGSSYLTTNVTPESSLDAISSYIFENEKAIEGLYDKLEYDVPDESTLVSISRTEETISGPDGNKIKLIFFRPVETSTSSRLPAVLYFHGGGMVILSTENRMHISWAEAMAKTGLVVIAVDFRNALTHSGLNPFPAGLNDCAAAIRWVNAHREKLGIGKIVLQGESGGGNLALACAIKAKREDWIQEIDGVCASVPFISGAWHMPLRWKLENLPSLVECDYYLSNCHTSALTARLYDPSGKNARNPLAWPYWATESDLIGLPPHLIVVNELDQLKDEGTAYCRTLTRAGVKAVGRMNLGVMHEGELFFRQALPDMFLATLWEFKTWVDRL